MTLASEYAERVAAAKADDVVVNASKPASLTGPGGGVAEVTPEGNLRLTPGSAASVFEVPPAAALAVADWINANFR
jgi:hypothetical protein